MKRVKGREPARPKRVRDVPLDGASSYRSFKGETKPGARKRPDSTRRVAPDAPTRRVAPDKGELSPR
jgi:hypothetical protein